MAASCSGGSLKPPPANEFSPSPNETPVPAIQVLPTEIPIFTPAQEATPTPTPEPPPEAIEKTVDEQAIEQAINALIYTLNSGHQTKAENGMFSNIHLFNDLNVKAQNLKEWENQIPDILNGGKSTVPLKTIWYGGGYYKDDNNNKGNGNKSTGELETNNVSIKNFQANQLSDADIANGLEWSGSIRFDYIERYRTNFYRGDGLGAFSKIKKWVNSPEKNGFKDFSAWKNTYLDLNISLVNGKWKTSILNNERRGTMFNGDQMFRGFTVPAEFFDNLSCYDPKNACQRLNTPLNKL